MKRAILLTAAVVLLFAVPAMADPYGTVDLKETSVSPQTTMTLYAPGYTNGPSVYTGVYHWALQNANVTQPNPFSMGNGDIRTWGFCIEMQDSPNSFKPYNLLDLDNAPVNKGPPDDGVRVVMGATKANYIRELWAAHIGEVTTNIKAAAFQAAVWEIVYEDKQAWDVDAWDSSNLANESSFKLAGNATVISTAQTWLDNLTGSGPRQNNLVALSAKDYQDYVVEVPAPGAILLGMMGLGLVGWLKRRVA